MKTKYRIVTDSYCGFAVEKWSWYLPFWKEIGFTNTYPTIEGAKARIEREKNPFKSKVVWIDDTKNGQ